MCVYIHLVILFHILYYYSCSVYCVWNAKEDINSYTFFISSHTILHQSHKFLTQLKTVFHLSSYIVATPLFPFGLSVFVHTIRTTSTTAPRERERESDVVFSLPSRRLLVVGSSLKLE